MAKTIEEIRELTFGLEGAKSLLNEINKDRVNQYGDWARKQWDIKYFDISSDMLLQSFTDWQREYHGIRLGCEYIMVFDVTDVSPSLLYVINVSANSVLCCMYVLFRLLMDKF